MRLAFIFSLLLTGAWTGLPAPLYDFLTATIKFNVGMPASQYLKYNFTITNYHSGNLASGNSDIFTVPNGKRAFIQQALFSTTNTAGTTMYAADKTNSTYYRITSGSSVSTNSANFVNPAIVLEPTEVFAVNGSNQGGNVTVLVVLYDSSVPIYSPRIMSLSGGNDTIYTVPAGTLGCILQFGELFNPGTSPSLSYINDSGSDKTTSIYYVPSGGAANSTTLLHQGPRTTAFRAGLNIPQLLPGDSVIIASSSNAATQWAYLNVFEIPYQ